MATTTTIKTAANMTKGLSWLTSPKKPRIPPGRDCGVCAAPQASQSQLDGSGIRAPQIWQRLSPGIS